MTEDGRIHRMAALCGRCLHLMRGWGKSDARLDAVTNSLWLVSAADPARALNSCFESQTSASASCPTSHPMSYHPNDEDLSLGTPARDLGHPSCPELPSDSAIPCLKSETWGTSISPNPGLKVETWATPSGYSARFRFRFFEEISHEDLPGK